MGEGEGHGGALFLRADDRPYRLAGTAGAEDRLLSAGLEVVDAAALDAAVAELEAAGVAVKRGGPEEAAERRVGSLVRFTDPGGIELELFCDPATDATPFVSPIGVSG